MPGTGGGDVAFRHGATTEGGISWRAYGKLLDRAHTELANGGRVDDAWHQGQAGLRADWERGANRFSVHGAAYRGRLGQPEPGAISVEGTALQLGTIKTEGANLTAQWQHAIDGGGSLSLQAYADHTRREVPPTFTEALDIVDLQFQHSLKPRGAHSLVWGANYRYSWDRVTNSEIIACILEHATVRSPLLPLEPGAEAEITAAIRSANLARVANQR